MTSNFFVAPRGGNMMSWKYTQRGVPMRLRDVQYLIAAVWSVLSGTAYAARPVRVMSRSEMMRIMRIQAARRRQM